MKQHIFSIMTIALICLSLFLTSCGTDDDDDVVKENGITGRVTDADTNEPIAGALVQIAGIGAGSVATDSDGRFFIEDIPNGTYDITVTAAGHETHSGTVTVTNNIATADVVLKKGTSPVLSGTVTDVGTGQPIPNAAISTLPVTQVAITDNTGQYRFDNLKPGRYTVTATATGYGANSAVVEIQEGQTARADIQLTAGGPSLSMTPTSLDFGANATSKLLTIENKGGGVLVWNITAPGEKWIAVNPRQGNVADIASIVDVTVDRAGVGAGLHTTTLVVTSNGGTAQIQVTMRVQ